MNKLFYVEDDKLLATELKQFFSKYNYDLIIIQDFSNVLAEIEHADPELVLLDVNLPVHDGFYWCREIRKNSQIPIIMLSSRDTKLDQMSGMTIGADDYLTKPIDLEMLLIKVQTLLRRSYDYNQTPTTNTALLKVGELQLNYQQFILTYQDKTEELTKNETKILQKLFEHQNEFVRRDLLMDYLWENEAFIDENTLNVNMSRLRKKIFEMTGTEYIQTKRMVGYKISEKSE